MSNVVYYGNVFYFHFLNSIGGVESFFYYMAKKYKDRDITILFSSGSREQIKRLRKFVRVKQYRGEKIVCDKVFFNYNIDIIDSIEAKEYYQIIHADFEAIHKKPLLHPKLKYIGVSQIVCDSFKRLTGIEAQLMYNPFIIEKPKPILKLISATRLTYEKGLERMIKLGEELNAAEIPYIWYLFTKDVKEIKKILKNDNIVFISPRYDIEKFISTMDYLVQLSDTESYCYSIAEALSVGIPIISTDLPVLKELGVSEKHGFILDFDLKNLDVQKIYEQKDKFNFTYKAPDDKYGKLLLGKSTYEEDFKRICKVRCIKKYWDFDLNKEKTPTDPVYELNSVRADELREVKVIKILDDGL